MGNKIVASLLLIVGLSLAIIVTIYPWFVSIETDAKEASISMPALWPIYWLLSGTVIISDIIAVWFLVSGSGES